MRLWLWQDDSAKPLVTQSQVTKREERSAFSFGFQEEDVAAKEAPLTGGGFSFGFGNGEDEMFGEGGEELETAEVEEDRAGSGGGFKFGFGNNDAGDADEEEEDQKGAVSPKRAAPRSSGHFGRRFDDESDDDTALDTARLAQMKRPAADDAGDDSSDDDFTRKGDGTRASGADDAWASKRQELMSDFRRKSKTAKQAVQRAKKPRV